MDGRKFRFHDNHEFFHAACSGDSRRQSPVQGQAVSRSQRLAAPPQESPHPDEHRKHCTAGEIASELGYSVSYILQKRVMAHRKPRTNDQRLTDHKP